MTRGSTTDGDGCLSLRHGCIIASSVEGQVSKLKVTVPVDGALHDIICDINIKLPFCDVSLVLYCHKT